MKLPEKWQKIVEQSAKVVYKVNNIENKRNCFCLHRCLFIFT